ncbi:MAG: DUF2809 domain-containing protein [Spirochaetales bacterium]|nr:DUF2809 domain-containing protein [Spirochaetales bacterium]
MIRFSFKDFIISILLLGLLVYIALFVRDRFIRPFLGDVLVVIWLYYTLKAFLNISCGRLAFGVFIFSYLIEFAQYFRVISWLGLEDVAIVRIVFGATFDFMDLLAYTLGWLVILGIDRISAPRCSGNPES